MSFAKCLKLIVLATVAVEIGLVFDTHGAPAWSLDAKAKTWTSHHNSYCRKKTSTPLIEDPTNILGFDVTRAACRESCEESADCKSFSYGKWLYINRFGIPSTWYGHMRCQLYGSVCDIAETPEMIVFEKPWHGYPAVALLTILNAVVLIIGRHWAAQTCSAVAALVSAWLVFGGQSFLEAGNASWDFQNKRFCVLAAVNTLNSVALLAVALMQGDAEEQLQEPPETLQEELARKLAQREKSRTSSTREKTGAEDSAEPEAGQQKPPEPKELLKPVGEQSEKPKEEPESVKAPAEKQGKGKGKGKGPPLPSTNVVEEEPESVKAPVEKQGKGEGKGKKVDALPLESYRIMPPKVEEKAQRKLKEKPKEETSKFMPKVAVDTQGILALKEVWEALQDKKAVQQLGIASKKIVQTSEQQGLTMLGHVKATLDGIEKKFGNAEVLVGLSEKERTKLLDELVVLSSFFVAAGFWDAELKTLKRNENKQVIIDVLSGQAQKFIQMQEAEDKLAKECADNPESNFAAEEKLAQFSLHQLLGIASVVKKDLIETVHVKIDELEAGAELATLRQQLQEREDARKWVLEQFKADKVEDQVFRSEQNGTLFSILLALSKFFSGEFRPPPTLNVEGIVAFAKGLPDNKEPPVRALRSSESLTDMIMESHGENDNNRLKTDDELIRRRQELLDGAKLLKSGAATAQIGALQTSLRETGAKITPQMEVLQQELLNAQSQMNQLKTVENEWEAQITHTLSRLQFKVPMGSKGKTHVIMQNLRDIASMFEGYMKGEEDKRAQQIKSSAGAASNGARRRTSTSASQPAASGE